MLKNLLFAAVVAASFIFLQRSRWIAVTIVRVGSNHKYSEGWEGAFGKRKSAAKPAPAAAASAKKGPAKKAASTKKKAAGKKRKKK